MSSDVAVQAAHLSKEYRIYTSARKRLAELLLPGRRRYHKRFRAIDQVSFDIARGTTVGIVGKNGSGKSTLLQLIAGTLTPTAGSLRTQGRLAALLELGSGFNADFTGLENVRLYCSMMKMTKREAEERIPDILAFADIGEFVDQPLKTYSSGMHVRLAFAAAIHIDPDILLIDEALAVGDPSFQLKCFSKIEDFKKAGKTIIFVSHDINAVTQFCDRVFVLSQGRLAFDGKPLDALNVYKALLFAAPRRGQVPSPLDHGEGPVIALNKHEHRFGTGDAEIDGIQLVDERGMPSQQFLSNELATVRFVVRAKTVVTNPVYGIFIKNKVGLQVYGQNSLHQDSVPRTLDPGQTQTVRFAVTLSLIPNDYFISMGVATMQDGNLLHLDRRNEVLPFRIIGTDQATGIANLNARIEVE